MKQIILASASPRRRELLAQIGLDFTVLPASGEEKITKQIPSEVVEELSGQKAEAVAEQIPDGIIIGADTVVCQDGEIMGKPKDEEDACRMLERLSGKYGYRYFIVDKERDEEGKIISSTYIREMLADGNIRKANDLLGYCYFVTGKVEHGNAIGHTKLYPTANLIPPAVKHLPKFGVYVTRVTVDGKVYGGLTNVGAKPTISGDNPIGVETYLYDFSGDLYGKEMKVELLDFVRPEMKFASIDALKAQLDHDIRECRERYHSFQKSQLG